MAAAAQHLASVTLELGGKSPAIVDRSADVQKASERILWGKLINAGQTCVAPDYVLVHRDRHDAFLEACQRVLDQRFGADEEARAESPHLCRLVSEGHHTGLQRLLDDAIASGARVVTGGTSRPKERYLSPTILTEVRPEMAVMQEEIFGPILPVLAVDSVDEAIAFVRARPKPLALYAFARDQRAVARLLSETSAGGSCVNTTILHLANAELPFGGVGESGMGSYHGRAGFLTCSHARSVLTQGCLDGTRSFYPPYGDKGLKLIRRAIRFLV
jgi:aldehyde dehydrogenase (NAD+)